MAEFLKVPDAAACIDVKNIYNLKKKIKNKKKKKESNKIKNVKETNIFCVIFTNIKAKLSNLTHFYSGHFSPTQADLASFFNFQLQSV